jgi:hypothetical protein
VWQGKKTYRQYEPAKLTSERVGRKEMPSRAPKFLFADNLNNLGVNDHEPLPALNPRPDRVSYSPVLHQIKPCAELEYAQASAALRREI